MHIHVHRATEAELAHLLHHARADSLTYTPTGAALDSAMASVPGLTRRHWTTRLEAPDAFARAAVALQTWAVHHGAGLELAASGPIAPGTNVGFRAPLPIGFIDGTCRIVAVVDEPHRYGFAYGTLSIHPEQGEESFVVTKNEDGNVSFDVVGISRPTQPLARLVPPVADRLQDRAVRRYLSAMAHAVGSD